MVINIFIPPPDLSLLIVRYSCVSRIFTPVDLQSRDPETFKPLHVVNMTIKDSPEEAEAAANDVLYLCRMVTMFHFFVHFTFSVLPTTPALDSFSSRFSHRLFVS